MAEKATIARPYAKAAFESARQHHALERWSKVLATASSVVQDERVAGLLSSPRVTPEQLSGLIADIVGSDLDEQTRNFLATLASNRRLVLLPEIASMYEGLRAEAENTADVQVVSAVELNEAQKQRLASALKKRLQREVRLHCEVDASLIGGAIVRAGDFVIDGSLKARLDRLAVEMSH
ncbi:ATP synthase subunit delta [Steroidobacter agaridevorans]|uniref:ATP synthase subunit delta n=1 Tax=Steroidobacter agaridevorans TaxID=2695856 RepID=A0A829Y5H0_9GAMM|nr:F0F1 ATP synthase subunit delta [Steroidobacter agaridevorans]GFE78409.1 ATP synthase subunit delta [Steroidobacter agaridevorans]GFE89659.1 ATP synthase subunit delta [Steroidobacter agaridevorans]